MTDPIDSVAEELGLPREQVEMVVNDMWKGIRHYIHDIHNMKFGILLPIFRIDLRIAVIYKNLEKMRQVRDMTSEFWQNVYNYWEVIIKNLPYSDKNGKHKRYKLLYNPDRLDPEKAKHMKPIRWDKPPEPKKLETEIKI